VLGLYVYCPSWYHIYLNNPYVPYTSAIDPEGGREGIVGKINKGARNSKRGFTARRGKSEQYDGNPKLYRRVLVTPRSPLTLNSGL